MSGKLPSLAFSVGLHAGVFFAMIYAPSVRLPSVPKPSPSEYQQAFAGKEDKIVWYKFKELPKISPQSSLSSRQPLRADVISKQAIVSAPKNAPKRIQVVLTPLPAIEPPPLDLPNLLAVKLPPKQFTTPPDVVKPETAKIDAPIEAQEYVPPTIPSTKLPSDRLPSRTFVPPLTRVAPERAKVAAVTEVPAIMPRSPYVNVPATKLPPRAIEPPDPAEVTIAIAGLNPVSTPVKLPAASSPAQFAAGEKLRSSGATSDGDGKGIVVPDLYAHAPDGSDNGKKPDLLAMVTATPGAKPFVARGEATIPAAPKPTGMRVSSAPDHRFDGRDVYMMAIQMSNLTSASGSWLVWYSPRSMDATALSQLTPPVPYLKVDPKYTPSAISDRVEGKVRLFCVIGRKGTVSAIELLQGADQRLDQSAEEALSKWEFYPATRNGQAVDVDVVVEIPFVLAPQHLR